MHILAIDQGTTGTTTILYDEAGSPVARAYREFTQIYPQPGWVEHDANEIWQTVVDTVEELCAAHPVEIAAVGITNQRETTVLWDQETGEPIHNAIVWQCRRTSDTCEALAEHAELFQHRTGLPLDAYFSGTKIKWILEHTESNSVDQVRFGTVDTWLIWKLTGGSVHATDHTNASRTLVYNIRDMSWDPELCGLLDIPDAILPEVRRSADDYGEVSSIPALKGVPIFGVAGDQQAALFGQACFGQGQMKNTYGTGCFAMMNSGAEAIASKHGLLTTLAVDGNGAPCYALEGSIFIAGAAIQWLRDELGLIENAADSEAAALSVDDNAGVYLVPAFVGLGAPHWNMSARGVLVGLTRGANRNHIIRAALESIAYQSCDVVSAMEADTGVTCDTLAVDGGAVANDFLMQFQADVLGKPIARPAVTESTSLGAAYLAGLRAGTWKNAEELSSHKRIERTFEPAMSEDQRQELLEGWRKALRQATVD